MFAKARDYFDNLYRAYMALLEDDGTLIAASVAFYMAVSFFPMLLVLISLGGLFLRYTGWGKDAQQYLLDLISDQISPSLSHQIDTVLSNVQEGASISGPLGLLTLLFASLAVFASIDDAMNRIWKVTPAGKGFLAAVRRLLVHRLRAFVMLCGLGLFIVAGFLILMVQAVAEQYAVSWLPRATLLWDTLSLGVAIGLNWLLLTMVYLTLSKEDVRWSEAARGGLLVSVLWEAGRRLLATFVVGTRFSVYGVVGAFVAIMLWVFYAAVILLYGAEFIRILHLRHSSLSDAGESRHPAEP